MFQQSNSAKNSKHKILMQLEVKASREIVMREWFHWDFPLVSFIRIIKIFWSNNNEKPSNNIGSKKSKIENAFWLGAQRNHSFVLLIIHTFFSILEPFFLIADSLQKRMENNTQKRLNFYCGKWCSIVCCFSFFNDSRQVHNLAGKK